MRRWFGRELGGGCRDAGGAWTLGRTGKREWGRAWAGVVGRWGGGVCGDHEDWEKGGWGGAWVGFGGCLRRCLPGGGRTGRRELGEFGRASVDAWWRCFAGTTKDCDEGVGVGLGGREGGQIFWFCVN